MDLTTDKIFYFVLFFLPGFIFIKVNSLVIVNKNSDFSKEWYNAVAYGCIFSGATYLIHQMLPYDFVWLLGILLAPVLTPFVIKKLIKRNFISNIIISPIPTAWDYVFGNRKPYWVILHLKDGRDVGGIYDDKSFTSSFPNPQDIYLEEVWQLDENNAFDKPIENTNGILIRMDEIISIEFFESRKENSDEQTK